MMSRRSLPGIAACPSFLASRRFDPILNRILMFLGPRSIAPENCIAVGQGNANDPCGRIFIVHWQLAIVNNNNRIFIVH